MKFIAGEGRTARCCSGWFGNPRFEKECFMKTYIATGLVVAALLGMAVSDAKAQYNYPAMLLQVPFLPQVPPGDWGNTKNCGPACAMMATGYYGNFCPSSQTITAADKWLAQRLHDNRYNDPNGWYTNFTGTNSLGILLAEYSALHYGPASGSNAGAILSEIQRGRPVIVGVRIQNGRLVTSGGIAHWALAVGWNARDQRIILNDPGTSTGRQIQYPIATFEQSWAIDGRKYSPVWK